MMDARLHLHHERRTFWTSGLVGMAFAAGWSPCIGPILAGILAIASQQHSGRRAVAFVLLSRFGAAVSGNRDCDRRSPSLLARIKPSLRAIEFAPGAFLIVVGLVLVNDAFLNVAGWFYQFVPQPNL